MIRFGIVGCGAIAPVHAEALKNIEGVTLAAFFDTDETRSTELATRFNALAATDLESLCRQVDAVIIATPSGRHAELGISAVKAGCHVIVEKPIDTTLAKAESLVQTAEECKRKLATVSQHRFANSIQRTRTAAQSGRLGTLIAADAYIKWYRTQAYYDSGDWRGTWELDGGGCLMNQGIHMIDMIQWIMGGIASVQAQVRTIAHSIPVEDIAQVLVEYRDGATGIIYGSTAIYPGFSERLEVHGAHGTIILESDRIRVWKADHVAAGQGLYGGGVMLQPTPTQHSADEIEAAILQESEADSTANWGEQHRLQLMDFAAAIQEDRDPFFTGKDSLEPLKVILAIYESARQNGARVEIPGN